MNRILALLSAADQHALIRRTLEQAFAALEAVQRHTTDPCIIEPLRLALVRLRELEGTDD